VSQAVAPPPGERLRRAALAALLVGVGVATALAAVLGGNPVVAVLPVAFVTLLYVVTRIPLHWSVSVLIVLVLSLEISSDAAGAWHSPLVILGDLLQHNLEVTAKIPGMKFSGLDVAALYLLGIWLARQWRAPAALRNSAIQWEPLLRPALLLYVGGVLYAELNGLARGGELAPWKVRHLLSIPLLFALFLVAYRVPRDLRHLGRLIVLAATVKGLLALYVQKVAAPALTGGELASATNHGDSLLFVVAAFVLLAHLMERWDLRRLAQVAVLLPVILVGMIENSRRIVWIMLAASLLAAYALSPWRAWKRALTRAALLAVPLALLYVGVGWERSERIFAPLRILHSVTDATIDTSTQWRETENWNLAMSLRAHPILGIGLGQEYTEFARGDDISSVFPEFKSWPHNSVLGLLLFAGIFGFTAIWGLYCLTVYLAMRAYHQAALPEERAAALTCVAATLCCAILAWGDTGAHHVQYRLITALALAISGKLSASTGPRGRGDAPA
jgi:O-antigen ligase